MDAHQKLVEAIAELQQQPHAPFPLIGHRTPARHARA